VSMHSGVRVEHIPVKSGQPILHNSSVQKYRRKSMSKDVGRQ
jgi:hypothetical protein